jgi:hypothetical protein
MTHNVILNDSFYTADIIYATTLPTTAFTLKNIFKLGSVVSFNYNGVIGKGVIQSFKYYDNQILPNAMIAPFTDNNYKSQFIEIPLTYLKLMRSKYH